MRASATTRSSRAWSGPVLRCRVRVALQGMKERLFRARRRSTLSRDELSVPATQAKPVAIWEESACLSRNGFSNRQEGLDASLRRWPWVDGSRHTRRPDVVGGIPDRFKLETPILYSRLGRLSCSRNRASDRWGIVKPYDGLRPTKHHGGQAGNKRSLVPPLENQARCRLHRRTVCGAQMCEAQATPGRSAAWKRFRRGKVQQRARKSEQPWRMVPKSK